MKAKKLFYPTAPVLLIKSGPLGALILYQPQSSSGPGFLHIESLKTVRGRFVHDASNHPLYQIKLCQNMQN